MSNSAINIDALRSVGISVSASSSTRSGRFSHASLSIAACLLFLFSFSYQQELTPEVEAISYSLFLTRVLPLALAALLSWSAVPRQDLLLLLRTLLSVPFVFWCWYALVGIISGVASEIQPLWSAWKCLEIVIVMCWAAAVFTRAKRDCHFQVLKSCYGYLLVASYVLLLWTLVSNFQDYGFGNLINLESSARLSNTWPNINPLSLAIIAAYCLLSPHYLLPSKHKVLTCVLSVIPLFILVGTRARTGIFAVGLFAVFSVLSRKSSPLKKAVILATLIAFILTLTQSESLGQVFRVSNYNEVVAGGGRFSSEIHENSAWAKSLDLIIESPFFGVGYLNVKRFIPTYDLPVDNFVLQALVSAGFVGAIPIIFYVLFLVFRWSWALTRDSIISRQPRMVGLGNVALSLAFSKALTTNELSNHGFALLLFLLVVISFKATQIKPRFDVGGRRITSTRWRISTNHKRSR